MNNSGFLYINKPAGMTSHAVVNRLRKITGIKKIGHAGTLDPFATGLLICGVGREATRELDRWLKKDKSYRATLHLGFESTTGDPEGDKTLINNSYIPQMSEIEDALNQFKGEISQMPPKYSALKIKGTPAYKLARQGKDVQLEPRMVTIHKVSLVNYHYPEVTFDVTVSSGTYIRSLAEDIGKTLGTGAYLVQLERTAIDKVRLEDAVELNMLTSENWKEYLNI